MLLKNKNYNILISNEDLILYNSFTWYVKDNGSGNLYLVRQDKDKKEISFHRSLFNLTDNKIHVDHINGNSLDNRRENLRLCTNSQNRKNSKRHKDNTTGFKGVRFSKRKYKLDKPYQAIIQCDKKVYILGYFKTAVEAAKAYDLKAKELHKDFARLNFPEETKNEI